MLDALTGVATCAKCFCLAR